MHTGGQAQLNEVNAAQAGEGLVAFLQRDDLRPTHECQRFGQRPRPRHGVKTSDQEGAAAQPHEALLLDQVATKLPEAIAETARFEAVRKHHAELRITRGVTLRSYRVRC